MDNPDVDFNIGGISVVMDGDTDTDTDTETDSDFGIDGRPTHPECDGADERGSMTGSSMCNGVDFMGIYTVATEACMAEQVDDVVSSSKITCISGEGYILEYTTDDCTGSETTTLASELDITVNCDAYYGDCDFLVVRHGDSFDDGETCSYDDRYYDVAMVMNDCYNVGGMGAAYVSMSCENEQIVVEEYLEDGCTGEPNSVVTQTMDNLDDLLPSIGGKSASPSMDGPEGDDERPDGPPEGDDERPEKPTEGDDERPDGPTEGDDERPDGPPEGDDEKPDGPPEGEDERPEGPPRRMLLDIFDEFEKLDMGTTEMPFPDSKGSKSPPSEEDLPDSKGPGPE